MVEFNKTAFRGKKILILGDVGLDEYYHGEVHRLSPEGPVPILEVQREEARLGLSANVALNISALGGEPLLISVVGKDQAAARIQGLLTEGGCSPEHLLGDSSRPTTRKTRVMTGHHHLVRIDHEQKQFLSEAIKGKLFSKVEAALPQCDGVILQDYGKGIISEDVAQGLIERARAHGKKVLVDPYRSTPLSHYRGADLMTPNRDESLALAGWVREGLHQSAGYIDEVGQQIMQVLGSTRLVITMGPEGMRLFEDAEITQIPTAARNVFDVTGAGDTVISTIALSWCSGFPLKQSCLWANAAAGVVVAKIGCGTCTPDELVEALMATQA